MGEVKELGSRLERWTQAYSNGSLTIKVSSNGRIMLANDGTRTVLSFIETMQLLRGLLDELRKHGFGAQE